jgi:hypothetical protein
MQIKNMNRMINKFLLNFGYVILIQILIYSTFSYWHGLASYGPRFLTDILPVLVIFLGIYLDHSDFAMANKRNWFIIGVLSVLLVWSIFVQVVGTFYYPNGGWEGDLRNHEGKLYANLDEKLWDWKDTQITRSFNAGPAPIAWKFMLPKLVEGIIYGKWDTSDLLLDNYTNEVLNISSKNGVIGLGINRNPITLNRSFAIEAIVEPFKDQVAYAGILGNHPGYNGFEGFVIQQDYLNQNTYSFGFANGKEWLPSINFFLRANELNYLLISVEENTTRVYINGSIVGSCDTKDSIANSEMPLYIGNWINSDRPFNGLIYEIRILNSSLTKEDILSN